MREALGHALHDARTARGLSLEAAGRAAKISQGYLHKLEAGRVGNPSPRVLLRLAGVLGVSYGRLMELAEYVMPDEPTGAPMTATQPPTNDELARLLDAMLRELAELKHGQADLARAVTRLSAPGPRTPTPSG
jgi:transcriptional regulator with XRE-family HTH domain